MQNKIIILIIFLIQTKRPNFDIFKLLVQIIFFIINFTKYLSNLVKNSVAGTFLS